MTRDPELEQRLAAALKGCCIGGRVQAFESVGSTMDVAHELAAAGAGEGTLVWAARQEQGRGRLGRTWASPEGGAYCSIILRPTRPAAEVPQLSLVAGLAASEAIQELTRLASSIRWPNDVLIGEQKVCGILTEARDGSVIIGIGINVATDPRELPDGSTSLAAEGAPHVSREDIIVALCRRFDRWYDRWTARGFAPIREALRPWMGMFGQPVQLTAGTQSLQGTATDLDEQGRLVVRLDSGVQQAFDVGEVTLLR